MPPSRSLSIPASPSEFFRSPPRQWRHTSLRLGELVENKSELVSESGIKERRDVERLIEAGFNGILIGETLMRSENIAEKFAELFE